MDKQNIEAEISRNKMLTNIAMVVGVIVLILAMLAFIGLFTKKEPTITPVIHDTPKENENPAPQPSPQPLRGADYEVFLNATASQLNQTLPMMINQFTRLDNAMVMPNNEFQYNYTLVNSYASEVDIMYMQQATRPTMLNMIKSSPELEQFRSYGTTLTYSYFDANGTFLYKMSFTPADYMNP